MVIFFNHYVSYEIKMSATSLVGQTRFKEKGKPMNYTLTVHLCLMQSVKKLVAENFFLRTMVAPLKSI